MISASRTPILKQMHELAARGIHCQGCAGECCTSRSNSMQITEREGLDILEDLRERGLLTSELVQKIDQTISAYRLDIEIPSFGARSNLRRTYTCPLYQAGPRGCPLSTPKKPYGCLAFNPVAENAAGLSSGCRSDQELLSECAHEGDKAPIPVMLKRLLVTWRE